VVNWSSGKVGRKIIFYQVSLKIFGDG